LKKINIIAEIGVNHCGKLRLAKKIIDLSKKIGADYVKFQTYITDELVTKNSSLADYQKRNLKLKLTQYEMLKKYELSFEDFNKLIKYCKKKKDWIHIHTI
jgi:N,N'-diacetyllegionaminate synthase